MTTAELFGLNTKWHCYQKGWTQEDFANHSHFKMAYISLVERGDCNITSRNIDEIAGALKIPPKLLFEEDTAILAKSLPPRVDMYKEMQAKLDNKE